jgi:uncharacterized protein YkwD
MRRLALLVVGVMLALGSHAVAGVSPAAVVVAQSGYSPDAEELAFVDLLNGYRGSLGLGPVTLNYELGAAADYHSVDMGTNNYFDHYLFDGTDPGTNIQNFGYTGFPWGENIAAGMGTAQEVLIAWQNSPEHNATMTNPEFAEVGIGRHYVEGSYYGWYWTATYGGGEAPQSAPEPLPAPVTASETTDVTMQTQAPDSVTTVNEAPAVVTNDGGAVELEQAAINADGDRAVSTGGNPVADGEGEAVYVGDINSGGVMGETIVYEEPSLNVSGGAPAPAPAPAPASEPAPVTTTTTTTAPPAAAVPVVTDPTLTETTVTNIETNDGNEGAYG